MKMGLTRIIRKHHGKIAIGLAGLTLLTMSACYSPSLKPIATESDRQAQIESDKIKNYSPAGISEIISNPDKFEGNLVQVSAFPVYANTECYGIGSETQYCYFGAWIKDEEDRQMLVQAIGKNNIDKMGSMAVIMMGMSQERVVNRVTIYGKFEKDHTITVHSVSGGFFGYWIELTK